MKKGLLVVSTLVVSMITGMLPFANLTLATDCSRQGHMGHIELCDDLTTYESVVLTTIQKENRTRKQIN